MVEEGDLEGKEENKKGGDGKEPEARETSHGDFWQFSLERA